MPSNQEIWDISETILNEEDDILVPLSKVLYLINEEKADWQLDLENLKEVLGQRPLFLIYDFPEEAELWPESEDANMAERGLFRGDKVMLLDKKPSPEDMQNIILGNLDTLYRSLENAMENQSVDGLEIDNYVQAMSRAKELYNKFSNLIIEEEENE